MSNAPKPKKEFRITARQNEIVKLIQSSHDEEGSFLWKEIDGKRKTFDVQKLTVSEDRTYVLATLKGNLPDLAAGDTAYLKVGSRESAFRAWVRECAGMHVYLTFPEEAVMRENRVHERHFFHASEEKTVEFRKVGPTASLRGKATRALVNDISESGICLLLNEENSQNLQLGDKLSIERLDMDAPPKSIKGEVVFKAPCAIRGILKNESGYKFGIRFEASILPSVMERFLTKRNIFSISNEKIIQDEVFRQKVHGNAKILRQKLSERKGFKNIFQALDVERSENHYLRQHIHLLCEVMCGLGNSLGWISDRTIDKLIYVAYLHDLRLMQYPRLAKIPSKKAFEEVKSKLTEEERKAFLEAPDYAADMARRDPESFPDAIKILMQQKELPDGSGFPNQMTNAALTPLSCLFIFSHYFVDYVISNPEWTAQDFIRSHRNRLKGQYFQKIFQVMEE